MFSRSEPRPIHFVTVFWFSIVFHVYLKSIGIYDIIICNLTVCIIYIYYGTPDVFICKFGNTCRGQALPDHFFLGPKVRMITGCEERFQKIKSEAGIMMIMVDDCHAGIMEIEKTGFRMGLDSFRMKWG